MNIALCLLQQTDYLLFRQLQALEKQFLAEGGMRERMTRLRIEERKKQKANNNNQQRES
ncbi:MAG: four helix bundle suffix domain-containing protein [Tannerellaceae bacterium]|nr:four helix bundle suffix domain-containing protein [Tannerellaceae bacterium]